ncbi:unnamed protein product [Chrysodeixis includens]|uniref:Uncharacterized protein n=1 Tax=Chrysodeixis includens TaxID=689277 RepID=A0A9P0BVZ1_CHRIL|nr:unnamed protein product [Chrysodeixis includens]
MKLLTLCVIFVTLQFTSTNYISSFYNHDWICDHELDTLSDFKVDTPKRSVNDKSKNKMNQISNGDKENNTNNVTSEGKDDFLLLETSFRVTDDDKGDDDYYVGKGPGQNFVAECVGNEVRQGDQCVIPDDKK